MSLDVAQLRSEVVRPALEAIGLHSEAAELLVLGTGATESGYRYIRQIGKGPAVGLWQMEPATYDDIWRNFLAYRTSLRAQVLAIVHRASGFEPPAQEMAWNLRLAAAMCRVHYHRRCRVGGVEKLPAPGDVRAMAETWKSAYNTRLGAGHPEDFVAAWQRIVAPVLRVQSEEA